jgi:hypothetical protein
MGRAYSTIGEKRNAYRILVRRPEGKQSVGRPRRRWVDIKMDLREIGWGGTDWIELVFFIVKSKCKYKKRPRQCPSGPLQHSLINILFCYSGLPASLEYIS